MTEKVAIIKRISLVDQVVKQLRKDIINSIYPSGIYLPTEIELTKRFGTSRLTVRSALQELAKEGLIEINQGRGSRVLNYRENVGLDLLPEIILATSREMISQGIFDVYRQHIRWLYGKICIEACRKARPSDREKLLDIVNGISEGTDFEEMWDIMVRLNRELLRITGNIFLMMLHNSHVNLMQKLLTDDEYEGPPYDDSFYKDFVPKLIEPICTNDEKRLRELFPGLRKASKNSLDRLFTRIAKRT